MFSRTVVSVARAAGSSSLLITYLGFRSLCSLHPRLNSATRYAGCYRGLSLSL